MMRNVQTQLKQIMQGRQFTMQNGERQTSMLFTLQPIQKQKKMLDQASVIPPLHRYDHMGSPSLLPTQQSRGVCGNSAIKHKCAIALRLPPMFSGQRKPLVSFGDRWVLHPCPPCTGQ